VQRSPIEQRKAAPAVKREAEEDWDGVQEFAA
jgi:hypothetical protein